MVQQLKPPSGAAPPFGELHHVVDAYADGVASAVGFGDDEVCAEVFDEANFGSCGAF